MIFDLVVAAEIGLAVAGHDDGVGEIAVCCDGIGGLVDDPIAVGSGGFEPPAVEVLLGGIWK